MGLHLPAWLSCPCPHPSPPPLQLAPFNEIASRVHMIDPKFPRCFSTVTVCALKGLCECRLRAPQQQQSASVPVPRELLPAAVKSQRQLLLVSAPTLTPALPAAVPALPCPALQMWTARSPSIWMWSTTKLSTTATRPGPGSSPGGPATRWVAGRCRCVTAGVTGSGGRDVCLAAGCVWHQLLAGAGAGAACRTAPCAAAQEGSRRFDSPAGWGEGLSTPGSGPSP